MLPEETDKFERFIRGILDSIKRNVTSSKPTKLQEAIEIANGLMDQKIRVFAARQADNKKRMDNNLREDYVQQPPYKRQNVARAYTTGHGEKKEYAGTLPLCNKCKYHHTGPRTAKCGNCKRIGHQTKDCKSLVTTTNQRAPVANQRTLTCFECGEQGHYRSECLELKNRNRGNQAGSSEARGRVYALRGGKTDQDPNNTVDDIGA
uniref:Reverse transcriptase domain-containing protein n=1 Tax=Tanacetum cinerariifolium TaxID=118510 RepID=A0A699GVS2_TANCI|nr:reverse transcriptase domain-containing protein [Tanacetum cinerariifolium]